MIAQAIIQLNKALEDYPTISGLKTSKEGTICITTIEGVFVTRSNPMEAETYIIENK